MRILVTGCGGMLGEAVYKEFRHKHEIHATDIDLNETWLNYLDVRYPDLYVYSIVDFLKPDIVFHLAALTDMEYCESNPQIAYETNFMGTVNMVRLAGYRNIPLVYISSAGIFDGRKEFYDESDTPNPLNVYAKSKYAGELVALSYPKSLVVRAGWMIGGGPKKDKKFVNKIIKQIRSGAKVLHVVDDKLGTPTYTYDLARIIHQLVEQKSWGIYHGTCSGGGSRVDIAAAILKGLGMNGNIKLESVKSSFFVNEYFARRPHSEKLISTKINSAPNWQDCLNEYLGKFEWKV